MEISKRKIDCAMVRAGIYTFSELAKKAEICAPVLTAVRNRGTCKPKTAAKLARALGVDVAEIMEEAKQQ